MLVKKKKWQIAIGFLPCLCVCGCVEGFLKGAVQIK